MNRQTRGTVVFVSKQRWLKINLKPVRIGVVDGAVFPHIVKVKYTAGDREYIKRKWIYTGTPVPSVGSYVTVIYSESDPAKAKIIFTPFLCDDIQTK